MIRKICQADIPQCVMVMKESFGTVAAEFGITEENAPRFTASATNEERLLWHLNVEHRPMYGYFEAGKVVGYYSLLLLDNQECELNNLCVLPDYRHKKIGGRLLKNAFEKARSMNCTRMRIGIVEENQVLRKWYEAYGFLHTGTEKFDFFPFTCGYLVKDLTKDSGEILYNCYSSSL
ncbi:MAG: GNAT family N-acetyltransferase [Lachnospiraceae bacterium]|nr:GNAT family N-acetyltransferase [Lachnospiraceae bacterium]MCI9297689.1 GNAT family N-acetyltransferase [Lachnospiraceae bacterium]